MAPISRKLTASSTKANVPRSCISRAARRNAPKAARERALPTLTRRTPRAASSAKLNRTPGRPIRTFHRAIDGTDDRRNVFLAGNGGDVPHPGLSANGIVPLSDRECVPGAGGGQGFETEVCQQPRRACVPGIGNDEGAAAPMKRAKREAFFNLRQHVAPGLGHGEIVPRFRKLGGKARLRP